MAHPQHLDGSVHKAESFIESGMTLITEVESEKWLKVHNENKKKENATDEFLERWSKE